MRVVAYRSVVTGALASAENGLRPLTQAAIEKGKAQVFISRMRGITSPTIRRELRRRSAVEPVIGDTKSDGMLERNHLARAQGDAINALLVAAGHNMRLLVAWLIALWRALLSSIATAAFAEPATA